MPLVHSWGHGSYLDVQWLSGCSAVWWKRLMRMEAAALFATVWFCLETQTWLSFFLSSHLSWTWRQSLFPMNRLYEFLVLQETQGFHLRERNTDIIIIYRGWASPWLLTIVSASRSRRWIFAPTCLVHIFDYFDNCYRCFTAGRPRNTSNVSWS